MGETGKRWELLVQALLLLVVLAPIGVMGVVLGVAATMDAWPLESDMLGRTVGIVGGMGLLALSALAVGLWWMYKWIHWGRR